MRTLSDADIEAIKKAFSEHRSVETCMECPVSTESLVAAIKFYDNLNAWFDETRKTIWTTVLKATVLLILGLIGLGLWRKGGLG